MRAYIAVSFSKRNELANEINSIKKVLQDNQIDYVVFIEKHQFTPDKENEMMKTALEEIDKCSILIAETTDKGIGIGIEAGYAKAKDKPVIYMRKNKAEHATTLSGLSDFKVIYNDTDDLEMQLAGIIKNYINPH